MMKKNKKTIAGNLIPQFVELFINPDLSDILQLFHTNGSFLGLDKYECLYMLKLISEKDQTNHIYCRFFYQKCNLSNSPYTHTIKILYINRRDFQQASKPSFKPNSETFGEANTRNFWIKFKGGKIFKLDIVPLSK